MNTKVDFITKPDSGYELIDSGDSEKLERFGEVILRRPDPQALWHKRLDDDAWNKNNASFVTAKTGGSWKKNDMPEKWNTTVKGVTLELSLSMFKHIGVFPEQSPNWEWTTQQIKKANRPIKVLNLFGYTGGATIAGSLGGASVVHVDSSKTSITHARHNAELSGVGDNEIRWIPEDARKFVEREIRRGEKYDAIIMDPPAFGHGIKKELWKIEEDLLPLVELTKKLLSDNPLFYILNGYSSGYSATAYKQNIDWLSEAYGGNVEYGELLIQEKDADRFLPAGITARWSKE